MELNEKKLQALLFKYPGEVESLFILALMSAGAKYRFTAVPVSEITQQMFIGNMTSEANLEDELKIEFQQRTSSIESLLSSLIAMVRDLAKGSPEDQVYSFVIALGIANYFSDLIGESLGTPQVQKLKATLQALSSVANTEYLHAQVEGRLPEDDNEVRKQLIEFFGGFEPALQYFWFPPATLKFFHSESELQHSFNILSRILLHNKEAHTLVFARWVFRIELMRIGIL